MSHAISDFDDLLKFILISGSQNGHFSEFTCYFHIKTERKEKGELI
jgi:hypothetical protein